MKEMNIAAVIENIDTVTDFVNKQLEALDCPMKAQMQIDIAIDELFSNIAHYAYNPGTGNATVRVEVIDDPILMFDEATSALDNLTQKTISHSLEKLKCTRIVIAHRLSTIQACDRIIYLENGKIAEDGTYDELIAIGGRFAQLVERQRLDT